MEFKSTHRFAKISPRKVRYVIDLIRGKTINDALEILRFTKKRASFMIDKVLRAAMASANESMEGDVDALCVSEARVDGGPVRKWFRPRARGMSAPILRRTSHIIIILSDNKKATK
ncbi:MAG: 50S ribosomal protein L22 [Candidatus Brocadiales bacterium]